MCSTDKCCNAKLPCLEAFYRATQNVRPRNEYLHSCIARPLLWFAMWRDRCIVSDFNGQSSNENRAGGLSLRSTRHACFFFIGQRTIDWKRLDEEPQMVLYKHSYRQDTIVFVASTDDFLATKLWFLIQIAVTPFFLTTM